LFCLLSVSHANPELGEAEGESEDAPLVERNPDIQTLMYYPGPKVDPRLMIHAEGEVIGALAEATQSPDSFLSDALKAEVSKAPQESPKICVVCQGLLDTGAAVGAGLLDDPEIFSIVFKGGKGIVSDGPYLRAIVTFPKVNAEGREYRVVVEAKALTIEGKTATNLEEALMGTMFNQYKIIQLRETTEDEDWNKLEQQVIDEKSDTILFT
jgi:hypothetical protein